MLNIGPQEILLILIVALVVVGPQRLPEMGRTLGRALRELRKAQDEVKRTVAVVLEEPKPAKASRGGGVSAAATSVPGAEGPTGADGEPAAADAPDAAPSAGAQAASLLRPLAETARELRKTREEIQRSFRVDLAGPPSVRPSKPSQVEPPVGSDGPADATGEGSDAGPTEAGEGAQTK